MQTMRWFHLLIRNLGQAMSRKNVAIILLLVLVALLVIWLDVPAAKPSRCGIERQAVKTLADKDAPSIMKGPIQASTVHDLIAHAAPTKQELLDATATRFPAEKMKVE